MRPVETVNKALLSTTSRLVGEFQQDGLLLTHAWPAANQSNASARLAEGPASRSAFVLVFESPPIDRSAAGPLPNYSNVPNQFVWYLSVLFGKQFENHGLTESIGYFNLPNLETFGTLCKSTLPHNSHQPRVDFPVPLNLAELGRIRSLFTEPAPSQTFLKIFQTSTKFYSQALHAFESDPEVAYLHLVTAIEILASLSTASAEELYDPSTRQYLIEIESGMRNGVLIARHFRSRMLSIKRRFVQTIVDLVDESFFERSECSDPFGRFRQESFKKCVGAAYDLRSRYVHTGAPFGSWVARSLAGINSEIQVGQPVVADKDYGRILANAPTFVGLERLVRYCILAVAKGKAVYTESPSADA